MCEGHGTKSGAGWCTLMQGQILDAAVTSNQGLILGDDGARYAFTSSGWRDNSVKPVAGMRVEFNPEGAAAMDVSVTQVASSPAPSPSSPVQAPAYTVPSQPPPQPAPPWISQPPPQRRVVTAPATPVPRTRRSTYVPRYPQSTESKAIIGLLLIFLGPIGNLISYFIIGARPGQWIAIVFIGVLMVLALGVFPPFTLILLFGWYFGCLIAGIYLLAISEESWNRLMHFRRDHTSGFWKEAKKEAEHCLTGLCRGETPTYT